MKLRSLAHEFRTALPALKHLSILRKLMNPENFLLRRKIQGTVNHSHQYQNTKGQINVLSKGIQVKRDELKYFLHSHHTPPILGLTMLSGGGL